MENYNMQVPYIVHESGMARLERIIKRLWIAVILLVLLLVATNGAWLWYESQFEYYDMEITQQNENGLNNFIGEDGNIYNGDKTLEEAFHEASDPND